MGASHGQQGTFWDGVIRFDHRGPWLRKRQKTSASRNSVEFHSLSGGPELFALLNEDTTSLEPVVYENVRHQEHLDGVSWAGLSASDQESMLQWVARVLRQGDTVTDTHRVHDMFSVLVSVRRGDVVVLHIRNRTGIVCAYSLSATGHDPKVANWKTLKQLVVAFQQQIQGHPKTKDILKAFGTLEYGDRRNYSLRYGW